MAIDIRRAGDRFRTDRDGITTFHSFSYGAHYDPDNVGFGPVIALNDELVPPGGGYDWHRHSDVAIHTLVLDGALAHEDSLGNSYVVEPGAIRSVTTGAGIEHAERNASDSAQLRFLQVMTREEPVDVESVTFAADDVRSIGTPALIHVIRGQLQIDDAVLEPGDEARLTGDGPYDVTASGPADALIVQVR